LPDTPPLKKVKMETNDEDIMMSPDINSSSVPSMSRPMNVPPLALPNPLAPAQPDLPFLPLFNQTASQRGVTLEYPATFSDGQWFVHCVVNGIRKGDSSHKPIFEELKPPT
jgi:hypothetical protein